MALLDIRKYPDPILRSTSAAVEVKDIDAAVKNLIDNMVETMYIFRGIGLAAPQVGVLNRIIIADIGEGPISLINPQILEGEGEEAGEEGCLSIPEVFLEVKRSRKAAVKGVDIKGKEVTLEAEGLLARVLQHEVDHLNGTLIIDRVSPIKRRLVIRELENLQKKQKKQW